jgi:hypothetical protein
VGKNIVESINLILYNFVKEKNDIVNDMLAISRHSWKSSANIEASFLIRTSEGGHPANKWTR